MSTNNLSSAQFDPKPVLDSAAAIRKNRTFTEDLVAMGHRKYDGFDHKCKGCGVSVDNAGAMKSHVRACRALDKFDVDKAQS